MRKTILALVAVLALGACSGPDVSVTINGKQQSAPSEVQKMSPDQKFDWALERAGLGRLGHSQTGYDVGRGICARIKTHGIDSVTHDLAETNFSIEDLGNVLAASMFAYCPDEKVSL